MPCRIALTTRVFGFPENDWKGTEFARYHAVNVSPSWIRRFGWLEVVCSTVTTSPSSRTGSSRAVSAQLKNSATTQAQSFDGGTIYSIRQIWMTYGCDCDPSIQQWTEYEREPPGTRGSNRDSMAGVCERLHRRSRCCQRRRRHCQLPVSSPYIWRIKKQVLKTPTESNVRRFL